MSYTALYRKFRPERFEDVKGQDHSPYSGIVHHLSGPNSYALTQIHPKTSGSVDCAPLARPQPTFTFITRMGFTPKHSHRR